LCALQFQIEEEEKKLKAAIEEAEKLYSEVSSEMKDLEIKSKQFEELEERLVSVLDVIILIGIFLSLALPFVYTVHSLQYFLFACSCWEIISQNHGYAAVFALSALLMLQILVMQS
jgi:hypothetical protein